MVGMKYVLYAVLKRELFVTFSFSFFNCHLKLKVEAATYRVCEAP
jgi:hypothetical protein